MDHDVRSVDPGGPEQTAREWVDAGIEVVDLVQANLALEDVQSGEGEAAVVHPTVLTDVLPRHEPDVDIEREASGMRGARLPSVPLTTDLGEADEPIEVGDGRRLVAVSGEIDMEGRARGHDTGNRLRVGARTSREDGCPDA